MDVNDVKAVKDVKPWFRDISCRFSLKVVLAACAFSTAMPEHVREGAVGELIRQPWAVNRRLGSFPCLQATTLGITESSHERRRKPGSDLVLILISFRDGFRGSFARTVLAFAATCIS